MSRSVHKPTIWLAGDWQHADFAAAIRWLGERACLLRLSLGEGTASPHAILVCQSRPGQTSQSAVEQWHSRAPLARLVALLGSWCEGESRSGRPWPGVMRVPWRTWPVRLPLALDLESRSMRLPRTLTDVERLQRESAALRTQKNRAAKWTAIIRTESRAMYDGISDALAALGMGSVWSAAAEALPAGCELEIIDGWKNVVDSPGPRRILLLHFPRPEDWTRAAAAGLAAVLPLPLHLAELAEAALRLAPQTATQQPAVA